MDLYLRAADEAAMNAILLAAGLIVENNGEFTPASGVTLDVIGSIVKWDDTVAPPTEIVCPGWHVNVRLASATEEQLAALAAVRISPPGLPFRVWA